MAFTTHCPHCDSHFAAPDTALGKKTRCKKCDEQFVAKRAPAFDDDEDDRPIRSNKTSSSRGRLRDHHDDDRPRRRHRDEEDEPRPQGRGRKKASGPPVLVFVLVGVVALVLVGAGVGAYVAFSKDSDKPTQAAGKADPPPGPSGVRPKTGPASIPAVDKWVEFKDPDGMFTAKFPQQPTRVFETEQTIVNEQPLQVNRYRAETSGYVASVGYAPIPGARPGDLFHPDEVKRIVDFVLTGILRHEQGMRELGRSSITQDGRDGREMTVTAADGSNGSVRVLVAKAKFFILLFASKQGKPDPATMNSFFERVLLD
jgi:hypothetical protein